MDTQQPDPEQPSSSFPAIREVDLDAPWRWLRLGWADLRANPLASLFYGLCFVVGGYALFWSAGHAPEVIPALLTGFMISGPFLAMGLYAISRQREKGEPVNLVDTLLVWRHNLANMGIFAGMLGILFLVWARASLVIFALFYSGPLPTTEDLVRYLITTDNWAFLATYFIVGGLFAAIAFALSLVTAPLMLDRRTDAVTAAITSVRALFANPVPMMLWAGLIAVLGMFGLLTLLLGILFIGPLLGHATWHAYRELIN